MDYGKFGKSGISGGAATAIGLGAGAAGLLLGANNNGDCGNGGVLGGLFGGNRNGNGCYVTEKEMHWINQSNDKSAVIAELKAEKYTDNKISMLQMEICHTNSKVAALEARVHGDEKLTAREFQAVYGAIACGDREEHAYAELLASTKVNAAQNVMFGDRIVCSADICHDRNCNTGGKKTAA